MIPYTKFRNKFVIDFAYRNWMDIANYGYKKEDKERNKINQNLILKEPNLYYTMQV